MLDIVLSGISQGLLWSIMAIGVFITFRILDIADLSAEGLFRWELRFVRCVSCTTSILS